MADTFLPLDQTVKDAMIPWSRVHYLSRSATRDEVMRLLAEHRFSRWPVLDPDTGAPNGYLSLKDLIVESPGDTGWTRVIRPLQVVSPHDSLELAVLALQGDAANMAIVIDGGRTVGLITLEDILEEIVGRIEDEYPRVPPLYLKDGLETGGVVLDLAAQRPEEAIRSLAAAIPPQNLPRGVFIRERLCRAASPRELVEIITAADPEGRKKSQLSEDQVSEENDQAEREDRWLDDGGQGQRYSGKGR